MGQGSCASPFSLLCFEGQRASQAGADRSAARPEPQGGLAKGQTTAIVTGVVSILFGVRRRPDALYNLCLL